LVKFSPDIALFEDGTQGETARWRDSSWRGYIGSRVVRLLRLDCACAAAHRPQSHPPDARVTSF